MTFGGIGGMEDDLGAKEDDLRLMEDNRGLRKDDLEIMEEGLGL